jgi:hypothetical protein
LNTCGYLHALQFKNVLMAIYFGADHFVWAYQIGLTTDKAAGERWQKLSLRAWALGSLCTVGVETYQILMSGVTRKEVCTVNALVSGVWTVSAQDIC